MGTKHAPQVKYLEDFWKPPMEQNDNRLKLMKMLKKIGKIQKYNWLR